ncbi:MAG: hypothetical protein CMN28_14570 [Salinisphaeraceae bacterium]|nr:hypothetical protein [Salinisphaeraceae bacterium]
MDSDRNRYIVDMTRKPHEAISASSWSGDTDLIDGRSLIAVAARDETQAVQIAIGSRQRPDAYESVEIGGFFYLVQRPAPFQPDARILARSSTVMMRNPAKTRSRFERDSLRVSVFV